VALMLFALAAFFVDGLGRPTEEPSPNRYATLVPVADAKPATRTSIKSRPRVRKLPAVAASAALPPTPPARLPEETDWCPPAIVSDGIANEITFSGNLVRGCGTFLGIHGSFMRIWASDNTFEGLPPLQVPTAFVTLSSAGAWRSPFDWVVLTISILIRNQVPRMDIGLRSDALIDVDALMNRDSLKQVTAQAADGKVCMRLSDVDGLLELKIRAARLDDLYLAIGCAGAVCQATRDSSFIRVLES